MCVLTNSLVNGSLGPLTITGWDRVRPKATDARNLPKLVKVVLRMKEKVAKSPDELLKWITNLNPELHTEHWRVLDRQLKLKGQRLILLIDCNSHKTIKEAGIRSSQDSLMGLLRS
jgi:hypothetical protein